MIYFVCETDPNNAKKRPSYERFEEEKRLGLMRES
ncbi:hypothetical protein ABIE26_003118 [Pedobacter africanus]|uniref:Uncharacterized protein n=1 Tax=Pedobacter africanus TaxID=151894 RepID=A0ACC6KWR0_9SPHI|nr:hypothetical protein [Pedobacter africanus]